MDDPEFSQEMIEQWRQEVAQARRYIFGTISPGLKGSTRRRRKNMNTKEMRGYLNALFENWMGVVPASSGHKEDFVIRHEYKDA